MSRAFDLFSALDVVEDSIFTPADGDAMAPADTDTLTDFDAYADADTEEIEVRWPAIDLRGDAFDIAATRVAEMKAVQACPIPAPVRVAAPSIRQSIPYDVLDVADIFTLAGLTGWLAFVAYQTSIIGTTAWALAQILS